MYMTWDIDLRNKYIHFTGNQVMDSNIINTTCQTTAFIQTGIYNFKHKSRLNESGLTAPLSFKHDLYLKSLSLTESNRDCTNVYFCWQIGYIIFPKNYITFIQHFPPQE